MAISPRVVKRRIKSVRSTGKIMKAMELVAASKMRKAVQLTLANRPYAAALAQMTGEVRAQLVNLTSMFLTGRTKPTARHTTLVVVLASDRGLCGGFNTYITRKAMEFMRGRPNDVLKAMTVGRRAERGVRQLGHEIVASFPAISNNPSFDQARPIAKAIVDAFLNESVDRIFLVYTDFKSALVQEPVAVQLLPMTPEEQLISLPSESSEQIGEIEDMNWSDDEEEGTTEKKDAWDDGGAKKAPEEEVYGPLIEPSIKELLETLLPRTIEVQIYKALLESSASEHSARMMAMRSAGEAAGEMVDDLTFTLNQARQSLITREISEISAGKAAIT